MYYIYKGFDPSIYGLQGIEPLLPVINHDDNRKYYMGGVAISDELFNHNSDLLVITTNTNGRIDIDNINIDKHTIQLQHLNVTFLDN